MEDYDRYIEKLKECKCLSVPELEKLFKKVWALSTGKRNSILRAKRSSSQSTSHCLR